MGSKKRKELKHLIYFSKPTGFDYETITNISAASPARQQGFYPYVNCTNVTAAAENSNAGRTGGYNTPMFNVTVEGYQSVKTVGEFSNKHYS